MRISVKLIKMPRKMIVSRIQILCIKGWLWWD